MGYILGIDQSTQGTKAILVDNKGRLRSRADQSHRQIVNERGWVSHDLEEIYQNTCRVIQDVVERTGISKNEIEVFPGCQDGLAAVKYRGSEREGSGGSVSGHYRQLADLQDDTGKGI